MPYRPLVVVGDNGYAVLDLLHFCQSLREPVTLITRLRLDAGLYDPAPPRQQGQDGRPRVKGSRQPTLKQRLDDPDLLRDTAPVSWYDGTTRIVELTSQTAVWYHHGKPTVPIRWALVHDPAGELDAQALLCTDQSVNSVQILQWFVLRWSASGGEVTYQEVRAHLGVETQRQWSDRAIARTTPVLMGLFSWITLAAHSLQQESPISQRTAARYAKPAPTFVDAIVLVRRRLWLAPESFSMSVWDDDRGKPFPDLHSQLIDSLAYAASTYKVQLTFDGHSFPCVREGWQCKHASANCMSPLVRYRERELKYTAPSPMSSPPSRARGIIPDPAPIENPECFRVCSMKLKGPSATAKESHPAIAATRPTAKTMQ